MKNISFKAMFFQNEYKAEIGDWEDGELVIDLTNREYHSKKTEFVDMIEINGYPMKLMRYTNSAKYVLGYDVVEQMDTKMGIEEVERFASILYIDFEKQSSLGHILGNNRLYRVKEVVVSNADNQRSKGIAKTIYKYFVMQKGWELLSDSHQYYGARKLWSRLSKELDVQVDIVDTREKKILHSDVILHHGYYEEDFDKRLWSLGEDKLHIRAILKKIIRDVE